MFELILKHFAAVGRREGAEILSADHPAAWPKEEIAAYTRLGLLKRASPARIVECPGCEDACLMPVHVFPTEDGRPPRLFIVCDKREDTGRVSIDPAILAQWQIDIPRFATLLASALGTGQPPDEIIQKRAYYLGSLVINRKRQSAFFIINNESMDLALESGLVEQYPHPFFLVAAGQPGPQEMKQGVAIPLLHILMPSEDGLGLDTRELAELLSAKSRVRQDIIPIAVPEGTGWNQIVISFVNEHTVQIRYPGNTEHRSFDEMGFSDLRRADSPEYQPSKLWRILRAFAEHHGEIVFQDSTGAFSSPEKVKKWVSQIRKKLREVFPTLQGDPFHPYNKVHGYKTRFTLNVNPSCL